MSHTPGPWTAVDFREHHIVSDKYDGSICFVYPKRGVPNEANAHLIAAAPDLLAACEAALRSYDLAHEVECNLGPEDVCSCHVGMLETAVKKAKGEKS